MWKRWETITESERNRIAEIADKHKVPMRDVASMYQGGQSFNDIVENLECPKLLEELRWKG